MCVRAQTFSEAPGFDISDNINFDSYESVTHLEDYVFTFSCNMIVGCYPVGWPPWCGTEVKSGQYGMKRYIVVAYLSIELSGLDLCGWLERIRP